MDEELLEYYMGMFPPSRPTTKEETAKAQELAANRKVWLTEEAKKRGIEKVGTLQKKLDKAMNKALKAKDKEAKKKIRRK